MRKRIFLIFLAFFLLVGCAEGEVDESGRPIKEPSSTILRTGELTLQMRKPDTLHPLLTKQKTCMEALGLIYDGLVTLDETMKPQSRLAESWEIGDNGRRLTMKMRNGVTWHTGKTFSAYDAAYSLNFVKNNDTIYSYRLADMSAARASDSSTLVIELARPNANFINYLTFPIIPQDATDLDTKPNGTGQYRFDSLVDQKKMVLTANEAFYLGKPKIERTEVLFFADDATAMSAFSANEINVLPTDGIDFSQFSIRDYMKPAPFATNQYEYIVFNFDKLLFQNEKIRQAVSLGINRSDMIKDTFIGSQAVNAPVHPQSYLYDASLDVVTYSEDQAKQTLQNDGFVDKDNDGVLEKDGISISFELLVNDNDEKRVGEAKQIVKNLSAIGMKVRYKALPWTQYVEAIQSGSFDAYLGGVDIACCGDLDFFLHSGGSMNYANYASTVMDLRLEGIDTSTEEEMLKENMRKFLRFFSQNQPIVGLYFKNASVLYHQSLQDVSVSPGGLYATVYQWSFAPVDNEEQG